MPARELEEQRRGRSPHCSGEGTPHAHLASGSSAALHVVNLGAAGELTGAWGWVASGITWIGEGRGLFRGTPLQLHPQTCVHKRSLQCLQPPEGVTAALTLSLCWPRGSSPGKGQRSSIWTLPPGLGRSGLCTARAHGAGLARSFRALKTTSSQSTQQPGPPT